MSNKINYNRPTKCGHEGYYSLDMCRSCYEKKLKENNKEYAIRQKENCKKWTESHTEEKREYDKKYREGITTEQKRETTLKSRYGITQIEYKELSAKQNHKCALCEISQEELDYLLVIDHDHLTRKIRGLLCRRCNLWIGFFDVDKNILKKAIEYLFNNKSIPNTSYYPGKPTGFKKGSYEFRRARSLRYNYKIDTEDYEKILKEQNNLCAICSEYKYKLVIDHNHQTEAVRGLLCHKCNLMVGFLELKPGIIDIIEKYLNGEFGLQIPTCKNRKDVSNWIKEKNNDQKI